MRPPSRRVLAAVRGAMHVAERVVASVAADCRVEGLEADVGRTRRKPGPAAQDVCSVARGSPLTWTKRL